MSGKLIGKSYVITGSFSSVSRNDIEKSILNNGGKVSNSISKNTSALILGLKPGSKLDKAKKLKIDIISEDDFIKLL